MAITKRPVLWNAVEEKWNGMCNEQVVDMSVLTNTGEKTYIQLWQLYYSIKEGTELDVESRKHKDEREY